MSFTSYQLLQTVQKMIFIQNRVWCDTASCTDAQTWWNISTIACSFPHDQLHVTFCQSCSFDNVTAAATEGHRQRMKNGRFITSYILYWKVFLSFSYINRSLLSKYFIVVQLSSEFWLSRLNCDLSRLNGLCGYFQGIDTRFILLYQ